MSKKYLIVSGIILVLTGIAVACTPQASDTSSQQTDATEIVAVETEAVESEAVTEESTSHTEEMGDESSEEVVQSDEEESMEESSDVNLVIFEIVQAESEARFSLGEILRGNPKTVVGVTDQVTGEMSVDFGNPANSQVGIIQINADSLTTVNNFRNGAIQKFVLVTNQFEFITFDPTTVAGLPDSISFGEEILFTITGELTVKDVTNEVTFDAKVIAVSETRLEGYASTIIAHADYDITIPEVQQVADVDEEVLLEIEFVVVPSGN